jgi:hypothetical protein
MSESFPRHLRNLFFAIGSALVLIAALNLVADPYQSFRCCNSDSLRKAAAGYGTRMGKGEMLARHDWDILLLGTSRVEAGLDPAHPAFAGSRVYNAGLPGADYPELDQAARTAMKRGTLKRLILCVDLFCFDPARHSTADADQSLITPGLNREEYFLANLLSLRATEASVETVRGAVHHAQARDYPLGLFAPHQTPGSHRRSDWPLGGALRLTLPAGIDRPNPPPLSDERFKSLAALLDDTSRAGIGVEVVHLPMHATGLEGYAALNIWPVYEQWIRRLSAVVTEHNRRFPDRPAAFWDFCQYNAVTTDPAFEKSAWFYDSYHLKVPLGNLVIDQIMGFASADQPAIPDLGLLVTNSNVEAHLAELRRDRETYYAADPEVKQIDAAIAREYRNRDAVGWESE